MLWRKRKQLAVSSRQGGLPAIAEILQYHLLCHFERAHLKIHEQEKNTTISQQKL